MSDRIQARAIRRAGELLQEFNSPGGRPAKTSAAADTSSQRRAAAEAGMSKRQQVTAVRVANVPHEAFEAAVESDDPPTVTVSEAIALASAIEREIGERRGRPRANGEIVQDLAQLEPGEKTRDYAARKAGFGNRETYRRAKLVVEHGAPEIVAAT